MLGFLKFFFLTVLVYSQFASADSVVLDSRDSQSEATKKKDDHVNKLLTLAKKRNFGANEQYEFIEILREINRAQFVNPNSILSLVAPTLFLHQNPGTMKDFISKFNAEKSDEMNCGLLDSAFDYASNSMGHGSTDLLFRKSLGQGFAEFEEMYSEMQLACPGNLQVREPDVKGLIGLICSGDLTSPIKCPKEWTLDESHSGFTECRRNVDVLALLPDDVRSFTEEHCEAGTITPRFGTHVQKVQCRLKQGQNSHPMACGSWNALYLDPNKDEDGFDISCEAKGVYSTADASLRKQSSKIEIFKMRTKSAFDILKAFGDVGFGVEKCKNALGMKDTIVRFAPDIRSLLDSTDKRPPRAKITETLIYDAFRILTGGKQIYAYVRSSPACDGQVANRLTESLNSLDQASASAASFFIQGNPCSMSVYLFQDLTMFHRITKNQFPGISNATYVEIPQTEMAAQAPVPNKQAPSSVRKNRTVRRNRK